MKTWEKLQNDHHQKWSTYLQQFHPNIKYKNGNTNKIVDFLSRALVEGLTMVHNSCGHENFRWSQLYDSDPDFTSTYEELCVGTPVV